jgi:hypothetical protein
MTKTQLKVDATRLLGSLKYAFSGGTAFIGELLQNARRAGASKVSIKLTLYTADGAAVKLTKDDIALHTNHAMSWYGSVGHASTHVTAVDIGIEDDGKGINSMQDLLHIAHSGWDDSVQQLEQPYGLGFMSAILAAKSVKVHSNGTEMSLDTEALLIDGESGICLNSGCQLPEGGGTLVELFKVTLPPRLTAKDFVLSLLKLVSGFPLPVELHDFGDLPRSHALKPDSKYWEEGSLVILPVRSTGVHLYLQGLPVGTTSQIFPRLEIQSYLPSRHAPAILDSGLENEGIAVHLDSSYRGRMPDRSYLYDEGGATARIDRDLRKWQFSVLSQYLARITGEALESFTAACISVLPASQVRQLFLYSNVLPGVYPISKLHPGMDPAWAHHFSGIDPVVVTRDAIAAGEVFHLAANSNVTVELLPHLLLRYKYFTAPIFDQAFPELAAACESKADAGIPDRTEVDAMSLCKKVVSKDFTDTDTDLSLTVKVGTYPSDIRKGPLYGTVFIHDCRRNWNRGDVTLVAFPSGLSKMDKNIRAMVVSNVARRVSTTTRMDPAITMFLLEAIGDDLEYIKSEMTKILTVQDELRSMLAGRKITLEMGADGHIKSIK